MKPRKPRQSKCVFCEGKGNTLNAIADRSATSKCTHCNGTGKQPKNEYDGKKDKDEFQSECRMFLLPKRGHKLKQIKRDTQAASAKRKKTTLPRLDPNRQWEEDHIG